MTHDICLSFDDIILVPQFSELRSRSEANTTSKIWIYDRKNPLISSNMETITGAKMAIAMWEAGGIGALHRFCSIQDNVKMYKEVCTKIAPVDQTSFARDCFVSVGVKEEDKERVKALYKADARMFIIDIAHGHSIMMKDMISWMRDQYQDKIYIVAGNVATADGAEALEFWGADVIKVGVGNGSVCTTRKVTGHGIPLFSSLLECSEVVKKAKIISDGGCRSSGDIVKALVAGADYIMCGSLFAGSFETPGEIIDGKKSYKGSSSYDRVGITKEGVETYVSVKGSVKPIVESLVGGIRSGMSYSNCKVLDDLRLKAKWKRQTLSAELEGQPHIFEKRNY